MRIELDRWADSHGESLEEYLDDRRERINELSMQEAIETAEDWMIENAFDDPEFWEAVIVGIKNTYKNKKNLLEVLFDLISSQHSEELEKYIKQIIYDYDLLQ